MKLDPVYLVAPRPVITTRRALLYATATGIAGCGLGVVTGWIWRGLVQEEPASAARSGPPTTDPRLLHAFQLASPATSIDILLANDAFLVAMIAESQKVGADTTPLWDAIDRIARHVADSPSLPDRARRARMLLGLATRPHPPEGQLDQLLPKLRQAAGQ